MARSRQRQHKPMHSGTGIVQETSSRDMSNECMGETKDANHPDGECLIPIFAGHPMMSPVPSEMTEQKMSKVFPKVEDLSLHRFNVKIKSLMVKKEGFFGLFH